MGFSVHFLFFSNKNIGIRKLSTASRAENPSKSSISGESAYEVLGVSESSSFAEIKASFRKLAKETHPDVSRSSHRFLQILAAYEILSDSEKRAYYDSYIFSQRKVLQKHPKSGSVMYMYNSSVTIAKQGEVVEWVKWYRLVIDDILTERRVAVGSGYFYELESELYSAIRAAYFGPNIESMDFLPDCFEAEERSVYDTPEVLHLVSGRNLFGIIYLVDKVPELSDTHHEKLTSSCSVAHDICRYVRQSNMGLSSTPVEKSDILKMNDEKGLSDIYKDLELHISGRLVAKATRSPPKCKSDSILAVDCEDQINVFLSLDEDKVYRSETASSSAQSNILLGSISGLGTKAEEGICSVYDRNGGEFPACECRCSRARLPPSNEDVLFSMFTYVTNNFVVSNRFWLFEPRSSIHDIGGWYVETFGRDKKGRTVPSQRQWDGVIEHPEKRLHPAMYLLALAYRTLDLEDEKRRKRAVRDLFPSKLSGILHWCKKLI
ncbi:uncharacterized protein LOC109848596 isoform X4 [Asparagus officinalis]|uniref:uncharacterized protein LOC109848596 isoform X4 n=1 Tax=Asparagus officinalis TaxID=4686 RepID=UPI00098E41E8|nr:uncharacterized protein LOC109848596 isoform X4 [Asparagus officinalis]